MPEFIPFDATTVELADSNLIEASAGTGKTYSIAILVLRLLLEKQCTIGELLMVTFTKAAVAELDERIRLFIRQANRASLGEPSGDETIDEIVVRAIESSSISAVRESLRNAMLTLDEIPVMTIHSFCQKALAEFAFETRQLFNAETLENSGAVITDEVNKFWRKSVTTIPEGLLKYLMGRKFARRSVEDVVKKHMGGKHFRFYDSDKSYGFCAEDHEKILQELKEIGQKTEELTQKINTFLTANETSIRAKIATEKAAIKAGYLELGIPDELIEKVSRAVKGNKAPSQYIERLFQEIITYCSDCKSVEDEINARVEQVISDLNCQAINMVEKGLQDHMLRNNLLTYDDLIKRLHESLTGRDNPRLIAALKKKYRAVFIDEFQDTDRLQYEIFQKIFGEDTILFYIGDPKQSIYSFRTADIFTYFQAGKHVANRYTMNTNYRSSGSFIEAMNLFFRPTDDFDTFFFGSNTDRIDYHKVDSPADNRKGVLLHNEEEATPLLVSVSKNKAQVLNNLRVQVMELLSGKIAIRAKGSERKIGPSDIGILVRTNKEGRLVKEILSRHGIPAVNVNDDKILQSEEAPWLLYILEAIHEPSKSAISRALLSPFTGLSREAILALDDQKSLEAFRKYRDEWSKDGVYSALTTFMNDFNVRALLLNGKTASGDRIISNLLQLLELLHKTQSRRQLSPLELLNWFQRGIEGLELLGDEYEQRIESDEEAIRIVTIHKSKGLEYNIVIAPFLDFKMRNDEKLVSYRDPQTGRYHTIQSVLQSAEQEAWVAEQTEQEHRRLLYVAITRAVYACYVHHNTYFKGSTISQFLDSMDYASIGLIRAVDYPKADKTYRYQRREAAPVLKDPAPVKFSLSENNWARMSYTMLAKKGEIVSRARASAHQEAYEDFMFRQLERGNKTGNLLHQIFETVNFASTDYWHEMIERALKQHAPQHPENYPALLHEMLDQICQADISINGITLKLSQVNYEHRLHEFEFDFLVDQYNPYELNSLADDDVEIRVGWDTPLQGILNGKMDLFFEYDGRYYVLDWKSNYLGDQLDDYCTASVAAAMNENNYHLQYLIYTLAAKKYLETRLPAFDYKSQFGGVIYLFVRGVRKNHGTGMYVNVPSLEKISKLESILEGVDNHG